MKSIFVFPLMGVGLPVAWVLWASRRALHCILGLGYIAVASVASILGDALWLRKHDEAYRERALLFCEIQYVKSNLPFE